MVLHVCHQPHFFSFSCFYFASFYIWWCTEIIDVLYLQLSPIPLLPKVGFLKVLWTAPVAEEEQMGRCGLLTSTFFLVFYLWTTRKRASFFFFLTEFELIRQGTVVRLQIENAVLWRDIEPISNYLKVWINRVQNFKVQLSSLCIFWMVLYIQKHPIVI